MKVMIVDDHAGVRNMIRQLLGAPGDSFVECATGETAIQAAREFKPDYITMDVRLPDLSGLEAALAIRTVHPSGRVIIVTSYDQPFLRQTASEVGAIAYVLKDNLAELRSVLVSATAPSPESSSGGQNHHSAKRSADAGSPCSSSAAESNAGSQSTPPSSADQPLRVLLVEDSENDCVLIIRQLRRCGFALRTRRVDNGLELRRALEQETWDIVITDNMLPTFSGAEALALMRSIGLNIPTLCVTGSADPVKMTHVLEAGASALISKDDLAPLCDAVKEALNRGAGRSGPGSSRPNESTIE